MCPRLPRAKSPDAGWRSAAPDGGLLAALEEARHRGLLGPGDVRAHVAHARAHAAAAGPPEPFLELGSGGGVPGLILLAEWPEISGSVLLDTSQRSVEWLIEAVETLGFSERVEIVRGRAEEAARRPEFRGRFALVVARSFAPPAVTAECAVGFLCSGGRAVVSEPPEPGPDRWPPAGLAGLGLTAEPVRSQERSFVRLTATAPVADRWPRRAPAKRPLW